MATNFYFNNYNSSQEQSLYENLIIESIKIYGQDMYYIPKNLVSVDTVLGEDDLSTFTRAFLVEIYIKNVMGFGGQGDFFSKFGVEIRDQTTLLMARRTFTDEIGKHTQAVRPNEGDLIYFPLNKKCFQIRFVEHESIFYPLGALQLYEMNCELFEYSSERFSTGIPEIDILTKNFSEDIFDYTLITENGDRLTDESGNFIVTELFDSVLRDPLDDTKKFQSEGDAILDFTELDPFTEGRY